MDKIAKLLSNWSQRSNKAEGFKVQYPRSSRILNLSASGILKLYLTKFIAANKAGGLKSISPVFKETELECFRYLEIILTKFIAANKAGGFKVQYPRLHPGWDVYLFSTPEWVEVVNPEIFS